MIFTYKGTKNISLLQLFGHFSYIELTYVYAYEPTSSYRATGLVNVKGDDNYADITTGWVSVTDGRVNVGFKGESSGSWVTADNFRLTYYGLPSADNQFDFTASVPALTGTGGDYKSYKEKYETTTATLGNMMYATLTDIIPNGVYEAEFYAAASYTDGRGFKSYAADGDENMTFVFGNEAQTSIPVVYRLDVDTAPTVTVSNIPVSAKSLTMGVQKEGQGSNWHLLAVKSLKLVGQDYMSAYASVLAAHQAKATALKATLDAKSETSPTAFLTTAASTSAASETVEAYQTAITTIDNSTKNAWNLYNYVYDNADYYSTMKNAISTIKDVEVKEDNTAAQSTLDSSVSTIAAAFNAATTTDGIQTQIEALRTAIYTYVDGLTPTGDPFDLTPTLENPSFAHNTTTGWIYSKTGGTNAASYTCNEFFNCTFDFYQELTSMPNGSYQLSVQAFSRPGDNGNSTAGAYYDYFNGVNAVTAELYLNAQSSRVGNIYSYKDNTTGAKVVGNDFNCTGLGTDNYWVPNNMQGASLYFSDNAYLTEVAALVENGTLRIGFRDETLTANQWTIFDNFKLYYYGEDKSIYYKQYLPQLEDEITANYLDNGAYSVLKTGQTERAALASANAANADELDTEDDLQAAIDAIIAARDNFVAAKTAYDNLNAQTTAYDDKINVGDGVFQMSSTQKETFDDAVSSASSMYSTGTASKAETEAALAAIDAAYILNAPSSSTHYNIKVATSEHAKLGNAIVMSLGATSDNNPTGYLFNASAAPASYLAQAVTFTSANDAEHPNRYYITFEGPVGTVYLTNGTNNGSAAGHKAGQIQGTTDSSKKMGFDIVATATENVFNIYNTETNGSIACQSEGNIYTENGNADFSVAEATEASVPGTIAAGKYATRIFPFTPSLPTGVKAYSCANVDGETLTLVEVATPAANVPYILENTTEKEANIDQSGYGVATTTSYTAGLLTGTYTETPITPDDNNYVLQTLNDKQAFYYVKDAFDNQPYRVYLSLPAQGGSAKPRTLYFNVDATGIAAISALTSDEVKAIYTTGGVKAQGLQKGLNIVQMKNGETKKIFVK